MLVPHSGQRRPNSRGLALARDHLSWEQQHPEPAQGVPAAIPTRPSHPATQVSRLVNTHTKPVIMNSRETSAVVQKGKRRLQLGPLRVSAPSQAWQLLDCVPGKDRDSSPLPPCFPGRPHAHL